MEKFYEKSLKLIDINKEMNEIEELINKEMFVEFETRFNQFKVDVGAFNKEVDDLLFAICDIINEKFEELNHLFELIQHSSE